MTRMVLITLLLLSGGPVYAEWVNLGGSTTATLYVDPETIRRNGNFVKMWILFDYKAIYINAGKSSWSLKAQSEFDCAEEQVRVLAQYEFSGPMGQGEIVDSDSNPHKSEPVMPGSFGQTEWKFACKKQ